jgi:4-amino-4-deoxy-L-arabinose transferase-like glycosyltransferase
MLNKSLAFKVLLLILVVGFFVRLYRFDNPIADWHSWRQADTSSVSRNFVTSGFDLLHPRFDDLSNVPSGLDNPQGYRFVEFPLYNVFQAGFFKYIGVLTLEEWGRLISIGASLFGSFVLFQLVNKYSGKKAGLAAAFFYTFLPYNIYYSRTILPDPSMASAAIGAVYFFSEWADSHGKDVKCFLTSLLLLMVAILLKPYTLFYGLPFLVLIYQEFGLKALRNFKLWMYVIAALTPFILWRLWMRQFPEGIPSNIWLLNGNGIRFRPSFFRWIGYERLTKLISGYAGVILLGMGGIQVIKEKRTLFYLSLIVSALAYLCVFATGNVQHDYYQIVIMPVVAIVFGLGAKYLLDTKEHKILTVKSVLFGIITILAFGLSWYQVKDYFNINNHAIVVAGKAVDEKIPKDAKVIANYSGDTSFLYQTKRKGWPSFEKSMPEMIALGADYLVLANPKAQDMYFAKDYKIISQTKDYLLFDLHQKP